jgi:hypothetical protein
LWLGSGCRLLGGDGRFSGRWGCCGGCCRRGNRRGGRLRRCRWVYTRRSCGGGNISRVSIAPYRGKQRIRRDDPARSQRGPPQEFTPRDVAALLLAGMWPLVLLLVSCHNIGLESKRTAFQYNIRLGRQGCCENKEQQLGIRIGIDKQNNIPYS